MATSHNSAPLADLVAQIRPFIRQMQHSISVAHASAQQTLTDLGSDIAGCNTIKATGEAEASSLETTKTSHSNDHKSCRTREKTAGDEFDGCQETLDALEGAKSTSCQLYEDAKQTPGCGGIPANAGETWESYVARAAIYFADERDSFMHKKAVCSNNTAKLEDKKKKCLGSDATLRKLYDDTKQECHDTQTQLESTTCSYVSKVNSTCNSFATCANALADSFDAQTSGMEALETQRKVEWNATERLLCLLDVYGSGGDVDATRLQTCQHIADNTSHLTLVYPTPIPLPGPCGALLPHPCDAAYTQAEYGSLDAPAGNCTPCAWVPQPTVPPPQKNPSEMFEASASTWDGTSPWVSTDGSHTSTAMSSVTKETKDGHESVRINSDSSYVDWGTFKWGTDVYPESSLEVFVYINSYPNKFNWLAGFFPVTHCMRYILLKDTRVGTVAPSCMAINQGGYGVNELPLHTWVQIVGVYDSTGHEYVVVDGQKSETRTISGGSTVNKHLRLGTPLGGHTTDANVALIRVYNKTLTSGEIAAS